MHRATKLTKLPALTVDCLHHSGWLIDNVFASPWNRVGMKTLLSRAGFGKRSSTPIDEVLGSVDVLMGKPLFRYSLPEWRQEVACSN